MSRGAFQDASKLVADHPETRDPEPDSPAMKSGQCGEVFFAYLGPAYASVNMLVALKP
jgi:hypothetical protein